MDFSLRVAHSAISCLYPLFFGACAASASCALSFVTADRCLSGADDGPAPEIKTSLRSALNQPSSFDGVKTCKGIPFKEASHV